MSIALAERPWLPAVAAERIAAVAERVAARDRGELGDHVFELARRNRRIHDRECVNLNPASNVMNPRAEALLSAGLGSRASLGYPGEKYETGLEAIEEIEIIAAELAAEVFAAPYAEVRVGSGALANMYAFMATCRPGDVIIAPPPSIGGHVTHHADGAAGLYGVTTVPAPVDLERYTVDVPALAELAQQVRPRLITIGGSLNLYPHPVAQIREIADAVGARVLFDAAHLCGMIAGGAWPNPLAQGAQLMTMSTYKSLGGPSGGLILTNDADLARRIEAIAYPGLTANFDAGKTAALAITLLDWQHCGAAYAHAMTSAAGTLAGELATAGVPVYTPAGRATESHQFAIEARSYGGGQTAAHALRAANLLTSGIGLPIEEVAGDLNGLRLGTPEAARIGMTDADMVVLAQFLARALRQAEPSASIAAEVSAWRRRFDHIGFTADS
ncbi:MAG TPA: aminotransferase class I/II-fold pyridoxal phosphate-dependent enzyme [Jatrophihabitans sp.]|jgi:glycine hydroxymethyltransferase|nr:aminotransferase class I/II-fold pyridoxal phosphate-dependent enzyme [Jatrophihabitans sp.]